MDGSLLEDGFDDPDESVVPKEIGVSAATSARCSVSGRMTETAAGRVPLPAARATALRVAVSYQPDPSTTADTAQVRLLL